MRLQDDVQTCNEEGVQHSCADFIDERAEVLALGILIGLDKY
jgi:hypothetical protein